jgi:hypothetical protein
LADGDTAPRGPSGFGGVPGITGFTEAPSPSGAVSEVFHDAEVADRVEYRFKDELRRIVNLSGRGMLVVSVARQLGSGNSFARLSRCPAQAERGLKKAPWVR